MRSLARRRVRRVGRRKAGSVRVLFGAALVLGSSGGVVLVSGGTAGAVNTSVTLYVSASGHETSGCATVSNPCETIQDAVDAAESSTYTDTHDTVTIDVAASTTAYTGGISIDAVTLSSLTIQGSEETTATVSGEGTREDFTVSGGIVTLEHLAIDTGSAEDGGGVHFEAPSGNTVFMTLDVFSGDHATGWGGGVYSTGSAVVMSTDTFVTDTATDGGGVYIANGVATVTGALFDADSATDGGGLYNGTSGSAYLRDVSFVTCPATNAGGGVFNASDSTVATFAVDSFEDDSSAFGGGLENVGKATLLGGVTFQTDMAARVGGGIYNRDGDATITHVEFSTDSAGVDGGGVGNADGGTVDVDSTTFSGDGATYNGGGVYNTTTGIVTVTDTTFSGDRATYYGGGVYNTTRSTVTVNDTTFSGDTASDGGGVYNVATSTVTVTDTTFSEDTASDGGGVYNNVSGGTVTAANSILDASSCSGDISGTDDVVTATTGCPSTEGATTTTSAIDLATILATTATYPTAPKTLALLPTSPAIDEVPATDCKVKTDERGAPRPGDTTGSHDQTGCDAGAYELQHRISTLTQSTPKTGSVDHGKSGSFQLSVSNAESTTGKVSFTETSGAVSGVTVATTGRISVSASTAPGTHVLEGTDTDPLHDSGTWSFTLYVTTPSVPAPGAPTPPSGATSHTSCSIASGTLTCTNDGVTVTASSGPGAVTISQYEVNPEGAPSFSSSGEYFDVELSPSSAFSTVTIEDCNLSSGSALYFWDPTTGSWEPVTPLSGPTGTPPCLTASLTETSSPTIASLSGTVFAVGTPPSSSPSTVRVYGATADATAAAEFTRAFPWTRGSCPTSREAVVATTAVFQDALSSQFLAGDLTTGTLLTPTKTLSSVTATTLEDEGITTVYVVGGPLAITTTVTDAIGALPADACGGKTPTGKIVVHRIYGQTQYGTAMKVAELVGKASTESFAGAYSTTNAKGGTGKYNDTGGKGTAAPSVPGPTAILASGEEFQDAQAASVLSYRTRLPLLLTEPTTLSTTALDAIEKLGVTQVVLMGGTLAVSNTVEAALAKAGISVLRVAGTDYTDTAAELARFEVGEDTAGLSWTPGRVLVARGNGFTDGLAGAVLENAHNTATGVFTTGRPLLLTESPTEVGTALTTFLETTGHSGMDGIAGKTISELTILGGKLALSTKVVTAIETDLSH